MKKSEIVVFKRGGKRSRQEKWKYKDQDIRVVTNYKYLGMDIAANGAVKNHLKMKLQAAKAGINAMWARIMDKERVSVPTKLKIYKAVTTAVMCYGAQVWGYKEHEEVENLQKFFFKRMLSLPQNTPTFALYLETDATKLTTLCLETHLKYIQRTLNMTDDRFIKTVTIHAIKNKTFWFKDLSELFATLGVRLRIDELNLKEMDVVKIIELKKQKDKELWIQRASSSESHRSVYYLLEDEKPSYMDAGLSKYMVSMICRARCDMLNLNDKPWRESTRRKCSLCNSWEVESTGHFIGTCPILGDVRENFLGRRELDGEQYEEWLKGKNWLSLGKFLVNGYKMRQELIKEFNY